MSAVPPEVAARLNELLVLPRSVDELARRFREAGYQLYLVGGSVRDALLQRPHEDLDFATDARPDEIIHVSAGWHQGTWLQGIEFNTVGLLRDGHRYEVTTFRGERYEPDSRKPVVTPVGSIEDDLARRDLTVNAMALSLPDRRFVDPHGGIADLAGKILRTPGDPHDSFSDDPLRMLRVARFAAQLGFTPVPELIAAIAQMRERLGIVSAERVRDELNKLLASPSPSTGLDLAVETGLCDLFLPELPALRDAADPLHRHKDVYRHTLAVLDKIVSSDGPEPDVVLRMAGLLHDIGKPATRRFDEDGVSFHHHEVVGARMAKARLEALRYPSAFIDEVHDLVFMHLRFHGFARGWTDSAVRRYVRDSGPLLDRLNRLVRCDCTTRNRFKARELSVAMDTFEERIARLAAEEDLARIRPPIDGNEIMEHLGVRPGRVVGDALAYLLEIRLERGEYSREEAFALLDEWHARRST